MSFRELVLLEELVIALGALNRGILSERVLGITYRSSSHILDDQWKAQGISAWEWHHSSSSHLLDTINFVLLNGSGEYLGIAPQLELALPGGPVEGTRDI